MAGRARLSSARRAVVDGVRRRAEDRRALPPAVSEALPSRMIHSLPTGSSETNLRRLMEKVVIIGSGCAGYTAALYTARANLRPLVLTGKQPGGLLTTTTIVENYPGFPEGIDGYELMVRMQKQAERFGARVKFGTVEAADLSRPPFVLTVDGERVEAETIIIASGASHRHLGVE